MLKALVTYFNFDCGSIAQPARVVALQAIGYRFESDYFQYVTWCSLVACLVWDQKVIGSNPIVSIIGTENGKQR